MIADHGGAERTQDVSQEDPADHGLAQVVRGSQQTEGDVIVKRHKAAHQHEDDGVKVEQGFVLKVLQQRGVEVAGLERPLLKVG